MRERWARIIALVTGLCLLGLAYWFAIAQESVRRSAVQARAATATMPQTVDADADQFEHGRELFIAQQCDSCHSLAGVGHPSYPLDGVGRRLDTAALRERMLAEGAGAAGLSPRVIRRKQRYRDLPARDIEALVAYLAAQ
jgi:mono/diheme cytochrome c family protein